jgi:hypothetical protein
MYLIGGVLSILVENIIHDHYARFGILMHTGTNGEKSKTEAIHIPKS